MKNRFQTKHRRDTSLLRELLMPALFFAGVLLLFWWGLYSIDRNTEAERLRSAGQAVTRAAVQCYAVEGRYPPDLAYLAEHYGLNVDKQRYIVHYYRFADNLMPEIAVWPMDLSAMQEEETEGDAP